jgi:hypothetical protein
LGTGGVEDTVEGAGGGNAGGVEGGGDIRDLCPTEVGGGNTASLINVTGGSYVSEAIVAPRGVGKHGLELDDSGI